MPYSRVTEGPAAEAVISFLALSKLLQPLVQHGRLQRRVLKGALHNFPNSRGGDKGSSVVFRPRDLEQFPVKFRFGDEEPQRGATFAARLVRYPVCRERLLRRLRSTEGKVQAPRASVFLFEALENSSSECHVHPVCARVDGVSPAPPASRACCHCFFLRAILHLVWNQLFCR